VKDLGDLIEDLRARGWGKLHVIAHSMGSRILGKAIDLNRDRKYKSPHLREIVFAAPDVDPNTFNNFSRAVVGGAAKVTVYVSRWDSALRVSSGLHGGDRVGLTRVQWPGMDVIDTRGMETSLVRRLGHSYLFDSGPVLNDLAYLMKGLGPENRQEITQAQDGCWQLQHRKD
jgi:esterase/lipase superfamily enzyme